MPPPRPAQPRPAAFALKDGVDSLNSEGRTLLYEAEGFIMASWKNITLQQWSTRATVTFASKLDEHSAPFVKANPNGVSAIHVITQNTPLPDGEVREMLRNITNKYANNLACVCHVLEGSGFWASALHSFLTGLHFASRAPYDLYIGSSGAAIAARLCDAHARRTGVKVTTDEIEGHIAAMKRRVAG